MTAYDLNAQTKLEKRIANSLISPVDKNKTVKEVFGEIDKWYLQLGPYKLLLLPFNGEWWYFDKFHESWEYTGYHAGEAIFLLKGDEIEIKEIKIPTSRIVKWQSIISSPYFTCPNCNQPLTSDSQFCNKCGAKIPQKPISLPTACPSCGGALKPGDKFCSKCGTMVNIPPPPPP